MADHPLRPATRLSLGGPLPRQLADRPRAHPRVTGPCGSPSFLATPAGVVVLSGISTPFGMLSQSQGQITHVLLTRAPLYSARRLFAFDLHVLGAPPTFALSQDQTLQLKLGNLSCSSASQASFEAPMHRNRIYELTQDAQLIIQQQLSRASAERFRSSANAIQFSETEALARLCFRLGLVERAETLHSVRPTVNRLFYLFLQLVSRPRSELSNQMPGFRDFAFRFRLLRPGASSVVGGVI